MLSPDDTQPRSPFRVEAPDDEPINNGPGCLVWALLGLVIAGISVLIIALSGFAGWSSGQRVAQANGAATLGAAVNAQLTLIPVDVQDGNQTLLVKRIQYLATMTPGVQGLDQIIQTATAVYQSSLPTATPLPSATATTPVVVEATSEEATAEATSAGGVDVAALYQQAQTDISLKDWNDAISTLDTIMAADSTYQPDKVRSMMLNALTSEAYLLFRSRNDADGLAEANLLTDRARQFGDIGDLSYESLIASQYLDAINSIGIDYVTAIQRLSAVYSQEPSYKNVASLLFGQYMAYGDALAAGGENCQAASEYQNALGIINDGSASAKLTNAQTACTNNPNPQPNLTPGASLIAPVGVGG